MTYSSDEDPRDWTVIGLDELDAWIKSGELRLLRSRIVRLPTDAGPAVDILLERAPQVGVDGDHRLILADLGAEPHLASAGGVSGEVVRARFGHLERLHPLSRRAAEMLSSRLGDRRALLGEPRFENAWRRRLLADACRDSRLGGESLLEALGVESDPRDRRGLDAGIDGWIDHWLDAPTMDRSGGSAPGIDSNPFTFHPARLRKDGSVAPRFKGGLRSLQLLAGCIRLFRDRDAKAPAFRTAAEIFERNRSAPAAPLTDWIADAGFRDALRALDNELTQGRTDGLDVWALLLFLHWRDACSDQVPANLDLPDLYRCCTAEGLVAAFETAIYLLGRYLRFSGLEMLEATLRRMVRAPLPPVEAIAAPRSAEVPQASGAIDAPGSKANPDAETEAGPAQTAQGDAKVAEPPADAGPMPPSSHQHSAAPGAAQEASEPTPCENEGGRPPAPLPSDALDSGEASAEDAAADNAGTKDVEAKSARADSASAEPPEPSDPDDGARK